MCPLYKHATQTVFGDVDDGATAMITVHPSYLLRVHDADGDREYAAFVRDLKLAVRFMQRAKVA